MGLSTKNTRAHLTWLLALGLASACGSTDAPIVDGGTPPENDTGSPDAGPPPPMGVLELGTGDGRFEPILDGAVVGLSRGFQGLQHVPVALRVREMHTDRAILELTLTRDRDGMVVSDPLRVRIPFVAYDGYDELTGIQLVTPDEDDVLSETVTLSAHVENRDGATAMADVGFSVVWEDELLTGEP